MEKPATDCDPVLTRVDGHGSPNTLTMDTVVHASEMSNLSGQTPGPSRSNFSTPSISVPVGGLSGPKELGCAPDRSNVAPSELYSTRAGRLIRPVNRLIQSMNAQTLRARSNMFKTWASSVLSVNSSP